MSLTLPFSHLIYLTCLLSVVQNNTGPRRDAGVVDISLAGSRSKEELLTNHCLLDSPHPNSTYGYLR